LTKEQLNIVFIGIGSNVGSKSDNIRKAIKLINALVDSRVEKVSSLYETLPFGDIEQNNFINSVIKISTKLTPHELFEELKSIEQKIGRAEREKWGPREIDLDILFYNDLIISGEIITLPHKGIIYRDFVMTPILEIEPEKVHPVFNKKIIDLNKELKTKYIITKITEPLITEEKYLGIE
jgi:2-amino-4-hydroxy-6-hydroxymethyldihydropteridine diphosphokinase